MHRASRVIEYLSTTFSNLTSFLDRSNHSASALPAPTSPSESKTVVLEEAKYNEMKKELKENSEEIKRLKQQNEQHRSLIHEYEGTFTLVLRKNLEEMLKKGEGGGKVETREQRLCSHIRALTRELSQNEERMEEIESESCHAIAMLERSCKEKEEALRDEKEMRMKLEKRIEVIKNKLDLIVERINEIASMSNKQSS